MPSSCNSWSVLYMRSRRKIFDISLEMPHLLLLTTWGIHFVCQNTVSCEIYLGVIVTKQNGVICNSTPLQCRIKYRWIYIDISNTTILSLSLAMLLTVCSKKRLFWLARQKHDSSTSLALCKWNPPVSGGFPSQRAVMRKSFSCHWVVILWPHVMIHTRYNIRNIQLQVSNCVHTSLAHLVNSQRHESYFTIYLASRVENEKNI